MVGADFVADRTMCVLTCCAALALWLSPTVALAQFESGPSAPRTANHRSAQPPQVIDIQIVGNRGVSVQEVRAELETRPGQKLDPIQIQRDVRALTKTRKFFDVKVKTRPGMQPGTVIVIYEVFEFPKLEYIHFIGNEEISTRNLLRQLDLKVGDPMDTVAVESGQRKLLSFYRERGYNKVQIEAREGTDHKDRGAVFLIHEGPQQRIWSVDFVGNSIVSGGRLKTQIQSKPSKIKYVTPLAKGYMNRRTVDEDVHRLTAYYRSLGYMLARVGRVIEFDDNDRWANLEFVIHEGPRFKVRNVSFSGNEVFGDHQLQRLVTLKAGEYFDLSLMTKDVSQLTDAYGSVGFVMADIKPSPRTLENAPEVDLVYDISEGHRYRIGRINVTIAGDNPHTQRSVALDRISLRPNDIADIRKVRDSERRLRASGLFLTDPLKGVRPRIAFSESDDQEAVVDNGKKSAGSGTFRGQSPNDSSSDRSASPTQPARRSSW
jgi:outer membrane protein insertion porin family